MIINIKKSRIVAMLFILAVFSMYTWLVIWTTNAIMERMSNQPASEEQQLDYIKVYGYEDKKQQNYMKMPVAPGPKNSKSRIVKLGQVKNQTRIEKTKSGCQKEMSKAQLRWFRARYNPEVMPLWTSENLDIDYQAFDWWLTLQNSAGIDTEEFLNKLFKIGVPSVDPYKRSVDEIAGNCRRCAVIGNSGNLYQSNYGKMIDKHDFVLRMNKAPTIGYENDVGTKTTHRFMYPESAMKELPPGVSFVLTPFKPLDIKWLHSALTTGEISKTYAAVPSKIHCDKSKVVIINPEFIRYVHGRWTQHHGKYPSTGMIAVIYALHECDEVNLFGFGADSNGNWHHYWEALPANIAGAFKSTGVHDPDWEKTILDQLQIQEIIHIHVPK